jgi:hypothetical protein
VKNKLFTSGMIFLLLLVIAGCPNSLKKKYESGEYETVSTLKVDEGAYLITDPEPDFSVPVPSFVAASKGEFTNKIVVTWESILTEGVTYNYNLYRSVNGGPFLKITPESGQNSNTFDDNNVQEFNSYRYAVRTVVSQTKWSRFSVASEGYVLSRVNTIDATFREDKNEIRVNWEPSLGSSYYKILRAEGEDSKDDDFVEVGRLLSETTYVDRAARAGGDVKDGVIYEYKIVAVNKQLSAEKTSSEVVKGAVLAPGAPAAITGVTATKRIFGDRIVVKWNANSEAACYQIFREKDPNGSFTTLLKETKDKEPSFEDTDVAGLEPGESYYYRVCGVGEEKDAGRLSTLDVNISKGSILEAPSTFAARYYETSTGDVEVVWSQVQGADSYLLYRSGPFESEMTEDNLASETWSYMSTSDEWTELVTEGDTPTTLDDQKKFVSFSYLETSDKIESGKKYYYKIIAINQAVIADTSLDSLSKDGGEPGYGATAFSGFVFLPVIEDLSKWLEATNQVDSPDGKIEVTLKIPEKYKNLAGAMKYIVTRTYRYGGGYQGHGSDDNDGTVNASLEPKPENSPWEKTISIAEISGNEIEGGKKVLIDTLYDTDENGNKLYACINKKVTFDCGSYCNSGSDGDSNDGNPWYERTKSQIESTSNDYKMILDPDGTPAGHEWHYLKWDYVFRKYLNHPDNPLASQPFQKKVNFEEAVRCDYSLKLVWDTSLAGVNDASTTSEKVYGYPSLTPREFTSLVFFLREEAFNRIWYLNYQAFEGFSLGKLTSGQSANGKSAGSVRFGDVEVTSLSGAGETNGVGDKYFYDFDNIGVQFSFRIKITVDAVGPLSGTFYIKTPLYNGYATLNGGIVSGLYQLWVHKGSLKVEYVSKGGTKAKKGSMDFKICNEYASNSMWGPKGGRYTSVGWPNNNYPNL